MYTIHDHAQDDVVSVHTAHEATLFLSRANFSKLSAWGWYVQNINRVAKQMKEADEKPGIGIWSAGYTYCITKNYS